MTSRPTPIQRITRLELMAAEMAARTVATALDDGREQVGGGGREGIIAASTRHVRLQSAKDSGADTSRERGIDEISAW